MEKVLLRTVKLNKSISISRHKLSLITTEVCVLNLSVVDIPRMRLKSLHQSGVFPVKFCAAAFLPFCFAES